MINKKLKNFLQLKTSHSKNSSDHTILKLRAIQKSREKSKQKKHESSFNAYHNQSFAETTQSTFHPRSKQKQKFNSINNQIKQLQQKVDILLCQKIQQRANTPSRRNPSSYGSHSKQRYNNSKQKSQNSTNVKNPTLRNSFLNTFDSFEQISAQNDYNEHNRSLLSLKLQAAKLLSYLSLKPEQINYFQQSNNPQQLFSQLSSVLNIHMNKRIKQAQQQAIQYKDRQIRKMQEQSQRLKSQLKHQQSLITQMQKQRISLKDKNLDLVMKNQQQQTQIYQLKLLYEQSQNNLIKVNIQHQNQCQTQKNKMKLQYQTKLHKLINNIQQKDYIHAQLRSIISDQSSKSHQYQVNTKLLLNDIEKWQREYIRLTQRYEEERLDKNNVQEEKNMEMYRFSQYKEMMAEGYVNLVEKLSKEMNVLRESQVGLEEQVVVLKSKIKQYEGRIKDIESDYLCLNDDYTRDVRDWVTKEEYYEKTVKELRNQIFEAYQTIAEYSKMLATYAGKNSALDTTRQE